MANKAKKVLIGTLSTIALAGVAGGGITLGVIFKNGVSFNNSKPSVVSNELTTLESNNKDFPAYNPVTKPESSKPTGGNQVTNKPSNGNQTQNKPNTGNTNNNQSSTSKDKIAVPNKVARVNFGLIPNTNFTRTTFNKMYNLKVEQNLVEGKIAFIDAEGQKHYDMIGVNPGDRIEVVVETNPGYEGYSLEKLYVFSADRNYRLKVWETEEGKIGFELPASHIKDPMTGATIPNPFYSSDLTINVEPKFNVTQIGEWKLSLNEGGYTFKLTNEIMKKFQDPALAEAGKQGVFVSDYVNYTMIERKTSPNLDMHFMGEYELDKDGLPLLNAYGNKIVVENTKYTLDLNGFDLYVSGLTIPSGVQLEITNSAVDQFNPNTPEAQKKESRVWGYKDRVTTYSFDIHGALGYWHGIKEMNYSNWEEYMAPDRNPDKVHMENNENGYGFKVKNFARHALFNAWPGDGQHHGKYPQWNNNIEDANKDGIMDGIQHTHELQGTKFQRVDGKIAAGGGR